MTVRTGVVQTPAGGALKAQLPLFLAGLGGRLGSGDQWLSWISLDDAVGLFAHAVLSAGLHGPVNGVAPMPVTGRDYART
ncbi:TIGR01777 family oxidoreductase, partial [Klebsiella pneumoniae]